MTPPQQPQRPQPQQPYGEGQGVAQPYAGQQPQYSEQPQFAGQQPQYIPQAPAPEPKKKSFFARHKFLTVVGAIVLLIVVIAIANSCGGSDKPRATSTGGASSASEPANESSAGESAPADDAAPDAATIGTAVTEDDFEFTITDAKAIGETVGTDPLSETAQGTFYEVDVAVKNVGSEAEYFLGDYVKLVDTEGRTHDADSMAAIYAGNSDALAATINPGNSATGPVIFDIPTDAVPDHVIFNPSLFGDGVTITLAQ